MEGNKALRNYLLILEDSLAVGLAIVSWRRVTCHTGAVA
jgi:hypothetical protein